MCPARVTSRPPAASRCRGRDCAGCWKILVPTAVSSSVDDLIIQLFHRLMKKRVEQIFFRKSLERTAGDAVMAPSSVRGRRVRALKAPVPSAPQPRTGAFLLPFAEDRRTDPDMRRPVGDRGGK